MAKRQNKKKLRSAGKAAKKGLSKVKKHGGLTAMLVAIGGAVTTLLASKEMHALIDELVGSAVDNVTRVLRQRSAHARQEQASADGLAGAST
jgi:hypothetical protein